MIFTHEQIVEIKQRLALLGIKDTQIRMLTKKELLELDGSETFVIVKGDENVRISLQTLFDKIAAIQASDGKDIFNVSNYIILEDPEHYPTGRISLEDAVAITPINLQKEGQIITFEDTDGKWRRYQMVANTDHTWNSYNFEELTSTSSSTPVTEKTNLSDFNNDVPFITPDTLAEQIARIMSEYITREELCGIINTLKNEDADKLYNWRYDSENTELIISPKPVSNEGTENDCIEP